MYRSTWNYLHLWNFWGILASPYIYSCFTWKRFASIQTCGLNLVILVDWRLTLCLLIRDLHTGTFGPQHPSICSKACLWSHYACSLFYKIPIHLQPRDAWALLFYFSSQFSQANLSFLLKTISNLVTNGRCRVSYQSASSLDRSHLRLCTVNLPDLIQFMLNTGLIEAWCVQPCGRDACVYAWFLTKHLHEKRLRSFRWNCFILYLVCSISRRFSCNCV